MLTSSKMDLGARLRPIMGMVQTPGVAVHGPDRDVKPPPARPFLTISREAGIDASGIAHRVVDLLNREDDEIATQPWTCWDRELVEKVAADQHLSRPLLESIEDAPHSWFQDILEGFGQVSETEEKAYYRVAGTVRALARTGRVVLVGRGGVYVTLGMPHGVHVQLIAPLEWRVWETQRKEGLSHKAAAASVAERDHNRDVFFKRHWSGRPLTPETFTATLNVASVPEDAVVRALGDLALGVAQSIKASPGRTG